MLKQTFLMKEKQKRIFPNKNIIENFCNFAALFGLMEDSWILMSASAFKLFQYLPNRTCSSGKLHCILQRMIMKKLVSSYCYENSFGFMGPLKEIQTTS